MKQLYKQPSGVGLIPTSARHQTTPSSSRSSFPRSQRLLFLVIGAFIASSFFLLRPLDSPHPSSFHRRTSAAGATAGTTVSGGLRFPTRPPPRRLPVGIRKPGLRVVVTGGAGFVGSHLVDRLMERGDSVIVIDNFFTGRKQNVVHHLGNPRFELIRHDVVEPILLEVDQIYHLACPASPVHYKFNPIKTIISFFNDIYFYAFFKFESCQISLQLFILW